MAAKKRTRASTRADDDRDARLRADGEDEMLRRWRDAEKRGVLDRDPNRLFFLVEVEKWASDARPTKMNEIRRSRGDREAEFRQGIAQEADRLLRQIFGQGYVLGSLAKGEWFEAERKRAAH